MRVLVVEDDAVLAAGLDEGLVRASFAVDCVGSAEHAWAALTLTAYDLAIVDIGLPGMDGVALVQRLRAAGHRVPVLILTARDALADRVRGLDGGADDYLVKPFLLPELLARVRALMRRSGAGAAPLLAFGPLVLDPASRSARLADAPFELTGREWDVLEQLILAAPRVVAKQKLAESLSHWDNEITTNAVEIYVSRLRSKLAPAAVCIRTVRGIGYRLDEGGPA